MYSCGITLWELITREVPFGEMSEPAIMKKVYMMEQRPDLNLVEPGCPGELLATVKHCWQQQAADR